MKKTILTIALTAVICFAVVGTTFAWLIDSTDPIKNTFTVGNVDITLTETDGAGAAVTGNEYKLIPGHTYTKDPKVTVAEGSESCWLFVKAAPVNNVSKYVDYTIADGWKELEGVDDIYYRIVADIDTTRTFEVIAGSTITVKDTLTSTELAQAKSNVPTLTFAAYAIQLDGFESESNSDADIAAAAKEAWDVIDDLYKVTSDTTT